MTPVTATVANGEEDQAVFSPRPFKSLIRPGIPIYRITGMLLQIKAFFILEVVQSIALKKVVIPWDEPVRVFLI